MTIYTVFLNGEIYGAFDDINKVWEYTNDFLDKNPEYEFENFKIFYCNLNQGRF